MKISVIVTAADIQNGVPGNGARCPVGLAISRALGKGVWATTTTVFRELVRAGAGDEALAWLPFDVQERIHLFDCGKPMEPFSFELEVA